VHLKAARWMSTTIASALLLTACHKSDTSSATPTAPTPGTAAFTVTFGENPVPFRSTGCNGSTPEGWYTTVRIQETAGISFTPRTLTQKLDGAAPSFLAESFASRFGACSGSQFTPGAIAANGAVCGVFGVCTTVTISSPLLQLGPRSAAQ
jgi:hypothetical protein